MQSIVTLTINPTVDKSASVEYVQPDRKLRCSTPRHEPGGGGINVARAIHNLGGTARALHASGGVIGSLLEALLDAEGIAHEAIPVSGMTRENLIVLEEATGRQYRFGMPGPQLQEPEWTRCLERLSQLDPPPAYLVASGSLPPGVPTDFYARVVEIGGGLGARVIVDTSGAALRAAARDGLYLLKPNLRELAEIVGADLADEREQEAAAQSIIDRAQAEVVVLSLGGAGALLVSREGIRRLRSPTVAIRSRVGAGDSMVAGIVVGLARGWPLEEAVRFGVAAGAAAVMTPGTELCRREDAERLYARMHTPAPATHTLTRKAEP